MPEDDSAPRPLFDFPGAGYLLTACPLDPRQRLNNIFQSRGMTNYLQWDITRQGPPHCSVWYAKCLGLSFSRPGYWTVFIPNS